MFDAFSIGRKVPQWLYHRNLHLKLIYVPNKQIKCIAHAIQRSAVLFAQERIVTIIQTLIEILPNDVVCHLMSPIGVSVHQTRIQPGMPNASTQTMPQRDKSLPNLFDACITAYRSYMLKQQSLFQYVFVDAVCHRIIHRDIRISFSNPYFNFPPFSFFPSSVPSPPF